MYITKANLNKTISDFDIMSYPAIVDDDEYWDCTIRFFNRLDKKKILVWKDVLKKGNFQDVFKKLKRRDSRRFVDPESFPAYHSDKNCRFLYNDFFGYEIPKHITKIDKIFEQIFDKGFNKIKKIDIKYLENHFKNYAEYKKQGYFDKMHNNQYQKYNGSEFDYVEKFRKWFKKNEYLLEGRSNVLYERVRMRFGDIGSIDQLIVEYANSGLATTTNQIKDVKDKIDKLLEESEKFINEREENYDIISYNDKRTHLYNNKEEMKKIASEMKIPADIISETLKTFHHKFKLKVIKNIQEYWILKLNPELSFSSHELDSVKFKKCKVCWDSEYIDDETLQDLEKDFGKKSSHKNSNAHKDAKKVEQSTSAFDLTDEEKKIMDDEIDKFQEFCKERDLQVKNINAVIGKVFGTVEKAGQKLLDIVKLNPNKTIFAIEKIAEMVIKREKPTPVDGKKFVEQLKDFTFLRDLDLSKVKIMLINYPHLGYWADVQKMNTNIPVIKDNFLIFGVLYYIIDKSDIAVKMWKKLNKTSDPLKIIRLNKVIREFNISLDRVVELLSSNGHEIKARPTTKITQVQYDLISNEFSKQ